MNAIATSTIKPWVLALRPKTLTAALVPVIVATALVAASARPVKWWVSVFAVLSALFIQIGTNLVNDAIDFKKGADRADRVGPQRVTQSGLLSAKTVMAGALTCFLIAMALGVPLVLEGGWVIVGIGLVSLFCGYAYTGGPFPLAYVGLGDLFVVIFFGLVAVLGTYFLHVGSVDGRGVVAGLQIGCLATVLIAINNLRDAHQDTRVGKRTLVVRFGTRFARAEIAALVFVPFALGAYWAAQGAYVAALLPCALLPFAVKLIAAVFRHSPGPVYNEFLARSAALHLFFGLLLSLGFFVDLNLGEFVDMTVNHSGLGVR